jgi:hypothetical protein
MHSIRGRICKKKMKENETKNTFALLKPKEEVQPFKPLAGHLKGKGAPCRR